MFVGLYISAVGMKRTNGVSWFANHTSRYVPLEWSTRYSSGYTASCVAPSYLFFVWIRLLVVL